MDLDDRILHYVLVLSGMFGGMVLTSAAQRLAEALELDICKWAKRLFQRRIRERWDSQAMSHDASEGARK